jgi:hypothetical protein
VYCFGILDLQSFCFCLLCAGVGKWMRSWKRRSRRRWASWTPSPPPRDQHQPQTQEIDITKQLNLSKSFTISKNRRCATHSIPRASLLLMFFFFILPVYNCFYFLINTNSHTRRSLNMSGDGTKSNFYIHTHTHFLYCCFFNLCWFSKRKTQIGAQVIFGLATNRLWPPEVVSKYTKIVLSSQDFKHTLLFCMTMINYSYLFYLYVRNGRIERAAEKSFCQPGKSFLQKQIKFLAFYWLLLYSAEAKMVQTCPIKIF